MSNKNYNSLERCSKHTTSPGNKPETGALKATLQNIPEDLTTYDDPAEIDGQLAYRCKQPTIPNRAMQTLIKIDP